MNQDMSIADIAAVTQIIVDSHYEPDVIADTVRSLDLIATAELALGVAFLSGSVMQAISPDSEGYGFTEANVPDDLPEYQVTAGRNAMRMVVACANDDIVAARMIVESALRGPDARRDVSTLLGAVLSTLHGLEHMLGQRPKFESA